MRLVRSRVVVGGAIYIALVAALALTSAAELVLTGRVVGVTDGDTLTLLRQTPEGPSEARVRLEGIDAPEGSQDYGARAKQRLSELAYGKTVRVEVKDFDEHGRLVARVKVGELDVSQEMVRSGLAWHFKKYSSDAGLDRLEREARAARRGLWSVVNPQPPWEYRSARAAGIGASPAAPFAAPRSPPAAAGSYHGNRSSKVFHRPGCQHYHCKNCTANFSTRDSAVAAGYRPGGCCRP